MARRALGPATLAAVRALRAVRRETPETPWLVACSGGPDSLALAATAARVAGEEPAVAVSAVVVDHGLHPRSAELARVALDQVRRLGLTDAVVRPVGPMPSGLGVEAAARDGRYAVLEAEAVARGADLLLGHTLDDQAETVLLGLLRGSGTRSLAGMASRSGRRVRPFLGLRRAQTLAVCAELGLEPWSDPDNTDPRFLRSAVRHEVLPVIAERLGGPAAGLAEALARTADLARDDADLLDRLAADLLVRSADDDRTLDCVLLAGAPAALRGRVIRRWLVDHGGTEPGFVHVRAVEALVTDWHGQQFVEVPGVRVRRAGGRLYADRASSPSPA